MHIQPYLYFDGRCDEAIALYRQALGAEVPTRPHSPLDIVSLIEP